MKNPSLILSIALVCLLACEKDQDPSPKDEECEVIVDVSTFDTIVSSEWVAAYPGSWWEYDNGETYVVEDFQLHAIVSESEDEDGCLVLEVDSLYLPSIPILGPVMNDEIVLPISSGGNYAERIILSIVDTTATGGMLSYYEEHDSYWTYSTRIMNKYDSMSVAGEMYYDVIAVKQSGNAGFHEENAVIMNLYQKTYYLDKDIGIIKYVYQDFEPGIYEVLELVDHYIAPH